MNLIKLAVGVAVVLALMTMAVAILQPATPAPVVAKQQFADDVRVIPLKKADRLPLQLASVTLTEPTPKHPDIELVPPRTMPPVVLVQDDEPAPLHAARRNTDICQRHGMHKVITHGGRSWRCRR